MPTIFNRVGLYAPGLEIVAGPVVDAIKRIDPALVVVRNKRSMRPTAADSGVRYEIYDSAAPGGPRWQLVMRVQEPDGSYRPLDPRVLRPLYEARGSSVDDVLDRLEAQEAAHERQIDRRVRNLGEELYDILWTAGRRLHGWGGTTVVWQARTDPSARERIRAEAGL